MKRENDMFLGRRNAKHYQPSFDRMIEETDYMLKRAHEIDDYTSSCLNAFIDMIRIMMFSDKTLDVFLTTPGLIEDSIMTFEHLVMFIRGVIISLRDGVLYERLIGATHIRVRPRKASQRRQRRNEPGVYYYLLLGIFLDTLTSSQR